MWQYPNFDPVAIQIGPISIYWYGLTYLISFILGWALAYYRGKDHNYPVRSEQTSDLIFYVALGVVIGGRCGYMLFYNLPSLLHDPLSLFRIWDGGMSFHGGLLGVFISLYLFSRKLKIKWFALTDFVAPLIPVGLACGRVGNFINAELWGRVTDVPWAMIFPTADLQPRHPSQLYEMLLEGVVLFTILWIYSSKPRPRMAVSALFLIFYSIFRFSLEFFREPDIQYGFIAFDWLTMGQLLSVPMFVLGVGLWLLRKTTEKT